MSSLATHLKTQVNTSAPQHFPTSTHSVSFVSPLKHLFMKFFIDTANLNEIKEAYNLGVLDGVTTNPSLMAKEGIAGAEKVKAHYKAICSIVDNNVSAEVIATDFDNIIKEGKELAKIDDKIVVKVPMIKEGVKAIKKFSSEGIRTNCTL